MSTEASQFYAMRTHSHTDKQQLWKVMSRPMSTQADAKNWQNFCASQEKNPAHEFFAVEVNPANKHTEDSYFYVLRTHSHTDRQQLWKVMSRPMKHRTDAETWQSFCESQEKNPAHSFFIVETSFL